MKVKDLIKELQLLDQESMVVISGYEGGCSEVSSATQKQIALDVHKSWYYGSHELIEDDYYKAQYPETRYKLEQAVYLS